MARLFFIMRESGKYKGWASEKSGDFFFVAVGVGGAGWERTGRKRRKLVDTDKDALPGQTLIRFL